MDTEKKIVHIERPLLTNDDLPITEKPSLRDTVTTSLKSSCQCSRTCLTDTILGFLPFIDVLRTYRWKSWIVKDILSGLSVGVIHIPQSMGFAILTSLPPVYGLYSSLFPILIYFIFGTSRHISVGTMAIISLMIGTIVDKEAESFVPHGSNVTNDLSIDGLNASVLSTGHYSQDKLVQLMNNTNGTAHEATHGEDPELVQHKVAIACAVTMAMGIIQFLLGVTRLGVIASFMSPSFIGGFLTGCAFHIYLSQIPFMLGLTGLAKFNGPFKLPLAFVEICRNLPRLNPAELVISALCLIFLITLKEIINKRCASKLKIPIPAELLLIVIVTTISYFAKLNEKFDVRILDNVSSGIPAPFVPPIGKVTSYFGDCVQIAIVSFAISISMAKMMANKHHYKVDQNQELIAYGLMHIGASFFSAFGGAQAPPRTLVHDSIGGKTQVASLFSCILLILCCVALGPLFEPLPNSALSCIICVALFPLFMAFADLKRYFTLSKYDGSVWVITCILVVFIDIVYGLILGLLVCVFTFVLHAHLIRGEVVKPLNQSEVYLAEAETESKSPNIAVYRFLSSVHFANAERCKAHIYETVLDPTVMIDDEIDANDNKLGDGDTKDEVIPLEGSEEKQSRPKLIIFDFRAVDFVDSLGVNVIRQIKNDYVALGMRVAFVSCSDSVRHNLVFSGCLKHEDIVYLSVQDAVVGMQS